MAAERVQISGMDRQLEFYIAGADGVRPDLPMSIEIMEQSAREALPREAYDYVAGSAGAESSCAANLASFHRWRIVPRMLRDVSKRDLSVELFGKKLSSPFILGPVGVQEIAHPDAELAVARAAASLDMPFCLSTVASYSIERVAEERGKGSQWFQLYCPKDRGLARSLIQRAEKARYSALIVTLDTGMLGWRERDLANAYLPFLKAQGLANYFSDPVFRGALASPPEADPAAAVRHWASLFSDLSLTWSDLAFLRESTSMPILVKGILHSDDAAAAVKAGVDGIIVSNHGGRQVDGAVSALEALPNVIERVKGRVPVLFDSGVRRGADAFKALALGAKAVLIGRPYMWGLAVAGEEGVRHVMANLLAEFDVTMAMSGRVSCNDIGLDALRYDPHGAG